ncbi:putative NADH-flavin reductase [Catenulispora sp. MAP12-49]|uniref:NAD(P)-dependent oxidoreductase n=1 Tax=Catenulispora sp. MAP12-49 TaxID=3156302 RepID=UPI00351340FF
MKVLLFGASGNIGLAIAQELLSRGHSVTGVTRRGAIEGLVHERFTAVAGDATDPATVADLAVSHDAVASAVGPKVGRESDRDTIVGATEALIAGLREAGVTRLVTIGGAGSLEAAPGRRVIDDPDFPQLWRANAEAQIEALGLYREVDDLEWTFISPAAHIGPGERTGVFRIGGDQLLTDSAGKSEITYADYAVAFVDELGRNTAIRRRITVAY